MYLQESTVRVRYGETDRMGYVYYGFYAQYYEVGRVEALRDLGVSYKQMEEEGIMLPVLEMHIKYIRPNYYDDLITIKTYIKEMVSSRLKFEHELFNEKGELVNKAEITLVCVDRETMKPCKPSQKLVDAIRKYIH